MGGHKLLAITVGVVVIATPLTYYFLKSSPHPLPVVPRWSGERHLVFACGRYEGIDQRAIDDAAGRMRVEEVSIGDYVLPGGESAAVVIIEAVLRLLSNVLGNPLSHQDDSQTAELARTRRPRGAAVRRPRSRRVVATAGRRGAHPGTPSRPVASAIGLKSAPRGTWS